MGCFTGIKKIKASVSSFLFGVNARSNTRLVHNGKLKPVRFFFTFDLIIIIMRTRCKFVLIQSCSDINATGPKEETGSV